MSFQSFFQSNATLDTWLPVVDAVLKATVLLGLAAVVTVLLRRGSAAVRHSIWTLALVGALALPVLSLALPKWQMPLVTIGSPVPAPVESMPSAPAPRRSTARPQLTPPATSGAIAEISGAPAAASRSRGDAPRELSWTAVLWTIWAVGVALVVGRLALGLAAVQWMSRRTERVTSASWLPLARDLAIEVGVARPITYLQSARATMPMAWGVVRPSVLMPADADTWPIERLRIVLLHELAHIKRRDCLTHMIGQLACALYWFNPLAWIAARHARAERERACDDLVLAAGTEGPDYAQELLEIARVMRSGRFPAVLAGATLAMAHRTQLEGRVIAILDPRLPRATMTRPRTATATAVLVLALLPLAVVQPWAFTDDPSSSAAAVELTSEPAAKPENASAPLQQSSEPRPQPGPEPEPRSPRSVGEVKTESVIESAVATVAESVSTSVTQALSGVSAQVSLSTADAIAGTVGAELGELAPKLAQESAGRRPADPRMVEALTAALKDVDKNVREAAMQSLIRLRDPAIVEPLIQALKDSSAEVREHAAHGLGQLRDPRAIDALTEALKDTNASVREQSVFALGQMKNPRSVDALLLALKDSNESVREQAAFAVGQLRDARAVDALALALKDTSASVREQAAFALGQIRDRRAATALAAAITDSNPSVRQQAVFALGQLRDPSAVDGLVIAVRDTNADVRQQAVFALGQIKDQRAVEPLISALKDSNPDVREQAAFALGQLKAKGAVEALVIALRDADGDVREQVAFALGQIKDPRATDALVAALKDSNADVRQQAAFALGQIAR